jgi:cysteine-rich repeat protein
MMRICKARWGLFALAVLFVACTEDAPPGTPDVPTHDGASPDIDDAGLVTDDIPGADTPPTEDAPDASADDVTDAAEADTPPMDAAVPPDVPVLDAPPVDAPPERCGNGRIDTGEQCDDGNVAPGDGCEPDCRFTCTTDSQCLDPEPCNGTERCDAVTHRCAAGTGLANGAACGTGRICRAATCVAAACGDGIVTAPEQCDDGNAVNGDGCDATCRFSCAMDAQCIDADVCNGTERCDTVAHRCVAGARAADGTRCGTYQLCRTGRCVMGACGDALVSSPEEQCDDGNAVNGDGCDTTCRFSCAMDSQCADTEPCNGAERCDTAAHRCAAGTALTDGAACGTGRICRTRVCVTSRCGDGFVDPMRGETCEPPTANCDPSTCTLVAPARCGDGRVTGTEECDDGNTARWDGCSDVCRLEQTLRIDTAALVGGSSALSQACDLTGDGANDNRLGQALTNLALGQINTGLQSSFTAGGTNILMHVLDLDDRLGVNDPAMRLALFEGLDATAPFQGTAGEAFAIRASALDASRNPRSVLSPGAIAARAVSAGPGSATIALDLGTGSPTPLSLSRATTRATTTTDAAAMRIGTLTGGRLCGAVTAADLDRIPAPMGLPANCVAAGGGSSLLDVIAIGCAVVIIPVVNASQPDIDLGGDGIFQGGTNRALRDTNGDRVVDTCRDGATGVTITGTNCAQDPRFDDAYSMALTYTALRVVITAVR